MKLCIVTPTIIKGDGQGLVNYEIVWEVIRRGHQVTLLAKQVDSDFHHHPQITLIVFPIEKVPTQLIQDMLFAWLTGQWLRKNRHQFDLIQVCGAVTSVPADVNIAHFVHSGWLNSPAHISRQGRGIYHRYQWLYTSMNAYWEKRAYQQARMTIAVSAKIRQELIEIGVPPDRIQVIHNGVDLDKFSPGTGDRQTFNLPANVTLALFVGAIRTNRKNLDTVLRALVNVPELHLAVAGATHQSPYPNLAIQLGLQERVHFLGFQRDIAGLMRAVDFFVFPSRYEPFGLVVLEAMAAGLPVVTSASAGGSEIVTPECGRVLPDPEDVEALAQALRILTVDQQLRQAMGEAACRVAQKHSWESKVKCYVDGFEKMSRQVEST
uniref:Glycosyl transferase group 1 n=1 Tax=Cyanothece sp. (strain PCC 7425 / ATCC 29141) TaxID=395961 RepID=B8HLI9_CYAP4